jgi:hypothetical protein
MNDISKRESEMKSASYNNPNSCSGNLVRNEAYGKQTMFRTLLEKSEICYQKSQEQSLISYVENIVRGEKNA